MTYRQRKIALNHLIATIGSLIFIAPFYCMLTTSLKTELQIQEVESLLDFVIPNPVVWKNYLDVLELIPYAQYFLNTIYVTAIGLLVTVIICSLVAFSFSRLRYPGRDFLFVVMISTMMLPHQVTMIPLFLIFNKLGWVNTFKPLWLIPSFLGMAFFTFLLRQFMMTIPRELEESAQMDGAGYLRLYWNVIMPLVKPALVTVIIFQFLFLWNDFLGPLIYIQDVRKMTLALGLQAFRHLHHTEWAYLMAAATLMTLPVIILFFLAQRYFIQGIILTGFKEY